jgi:hypothetical protein
MNQPQIGIILHTLWKFLANYPSGLGYSNLVLVQFWNQTQNQVSFLELDTTRTTSRGFGYGTKLKPPPFGYGIASNQNWTWGELELYQDFFQILIPILWFREFFVSLKNLKLLLHLFKEA